MDEIQRQKIIAKIQKLRLMADFCNPNPKTMHYEVLKERCEYLKVSEKGVSGMCAFSEELLAEGRAEGRMEGRAEGILQSVRNLMESSKISVNVAMDILKVSDNDRPKILAAL